MSNTKKKVDLYNTDGDFVQSFDSVSAVAKEFEVNHCAVLYWIGTGRKKNGYTFKFHDENDCSLSRNYQYYKVKPIQDKGVDRDKYKIIKYEVVNKRVSITPCPYKQHPKPMVGSCACLKCSSNKGRDRLTHEVACNRAFQ